MDDINDRFKAFSALGFNYSDSVALANGISFCVDYFSDLLREEFYPILPAPSNMNEEKL